MEVLIGITAASILQYMHYQTSTLHTLNIHDINYISIKLGKKVLTAPSHVFVTLPQDTRERGVPRPQEHEVTSQPCLRVVSAPRGQPVLRLPVDFVLSVRTRDGT